MFCFVLFLLTVMHNTTLTLLDNSFQQGVACFKHKCGILDGTPYEDLDLTMKELRAKYIDCFTTFHKYEQEGGPKPSYYGVISRLSTSDKVKAKFAKFCKDNGCYP